MATKEMRITKGFPFITLVSSQIEKYIINIQIRSTVHL